MKNRKPATVNAKPFLSGSPTDENSFRQAIGFLGTLLLVAFMSFLVCSMTGVQSVFLRILINTAIEALILLIFFSRGVQLGTDATARGEILYQHVEKGLPASQSEKKIPFHILKGFMIGFLGSFLFFVLALFLAFTARKQMTGPGTLPSWTEGYMHRSEIGGALVAYTNPSALNFTDIIRIIVRMLIMPFVSMAGTENKDLLLTVERISPLLVLLPALSYGIGYLQGPSRRKLIHSEIVSNNRKRIIREKKERRKKQGIASKGPQQLN